MPSIASTDVSSSRRDPAWDTQTDERHELGASKTSKCANVRSHQNVLDEHSGGASTRARTTGGSSVSRREASTMDPVYTQWQEQRSGSRRCHTRTVQKLDRGVDGRSCITLLTDSSSSTSHRAAGGTGRDHGASTGTRHVECLILCGSVTKAPSARQRSLPLKTVSTVFDCVSGSMGGKSAPQTLIGCHQRKALASR